MKRIIATMVSVGALTALAAGTAHPAPYAGTDSSRQLVGKWAGTVTHGGTTGDIELIFTPSGKACLITSAGVSRGSWKSTGGAGDFNYKIAEAMIDETGTQLGWIHIDQNTEAVSSAFTSTGVSHVYDMAGNPQFTQVADVDVHRVAGAPRC
ncbi:MULTISPECIES: hypothetical protein [unclassified Streptomyces]|uniref:hypothetical protein n=1 Tax=unclassified Streptomyces TaxID=2593676 RepID=UPI002252C34C|nr:MULTISPECIES: hypothetical protein [unclassified Streptomyces]MCX5440586.1 hypothetical protein [Streptomyces sp. NBC_00063]WSE18071.1 hypothetical protein OG518_34615 [Streptomyces sp. NBC_01397]WUB93036.1 hypothetical protein OHO83_12440 [Streptomyces sp. NBC_00569]